MNKILRRLFLSSLLLLTALPGVYASGEKEDRLETAKALMAQKRYDEAMSVLRQLSEEEPERLDQAEVLQREIRFILEQSIRLRTESAAALKAERFEEADLLRRQAESLLPNPNKAYADLAKQQARSIIFQSSLKKFNDLMAAARELLDRQAYGQAAETYLEGYSYHREEFDQADYGNLLKADVLAALGDMEAAAREFISREAEFRRIRQQTLTLISSGDPQTLGQSLAAALGVWRSYGALATRINQAARVYQTQFDLIVQARGIDNKDFFLEYNTTVTRGRRGIRNEGLYKSLLLPWLAGLEEWSSAFKTRADQLLAQGEASWNGRRWGEAQTRFGELNSLALAALRTLSLYNQALVTDTRDPDVFTLEAQQGTLSRLWYFTTLAQVAGLGTASAQRELALEGRTPQTLSTQAALAQARQEVVQARAAYSEEIRGLAALNSAYTPYASQGWNLNQGPQVLSRISTAWQGAVQNLITREISLVSALATQDLQSLERAYAEVDRTQGEIAFLVNGRTAEDAQRFPQQALAQLRIQEGSQSSLRTSVASFLTTYRQELTALANPQPLRVPVDQGQALLTRLDNLISRRQALSSQAQTAYNRHLELRQQAQILYRSAQTAGTQLRFPQARQALEQFFTLAVQALEFQTDPVYAAQSERDYSELRSFLIAEENKIVVREVNALVNQGREAFNNLRFIQAEELFNRADTRWLDTNSERSSVVVKWLNNVANALSVTSGREIAVTDTQYSAITQLINFAKASLGRAEQLAETQVTQRQTLLEEAQRYVNKVKFAYPLYQEARVLGLRIELEKNRSGARQLLADYFASALRKTRSANQADKSEGYQELQDLRGLDPNYPGLAGAILEVQYDLEIVARPPDPRLIAQSRSLTNQARAIYDSGNVNQYPRAMSLVDEALRLDPTNATAEEVKIRLSAETGGAPEPVSLGDRNILNQITALIAAGNLRQATNLFRTFDPQGRYRFNPEVAEIRRQLGVQ